MNGLLYRPLPGRETASMQAIFTSNSRGGLYGASSFADFRSFMESAPEIFAGACAVARVTANVGAGQTSQAAPGALMNGGCFEALRVRPHLGRLLQPSDDAPAGSPPAIVVSHALWSRAFDAAPDIVGRHVQVNGVPVVIVGVAEMGFAGLSLDSSAEFWAPPTLWTALFSGSSMTERGDRRFRIYARLTEGVTATQASARLGAIASRLRTEDPDAWTDSRNETRAVTVMPERESRFASGAPNARAGIAMMTLGATAAIVLIACVNLATMIVARGAGRARELNIRIALGASKGRVLRQLATESLLISIGGVVIGVLVIATALRLFDANRPPVPAFNLAMDWRVAVFAAIVAFAAPMFFGVVPGLHALKLAIAQGLRDRPVFFRRRYLRVGPRELLLFVQVAMSFALLVSSAVFLKSLVMTSSRPAGSSATVATVPIDLSSAATSDQDRRALTARLLEAASRVADVDAPTAAAIVPLTGSFFGVAGRADSREDSAELSFDANIVAPGYFSLVGIAARGGRTFGAGDHDRAPLVAVVSESLGRQLWKNAAAVGQTVWLERGPAQVIGVVADVPYRSLSDQAQPVLYLAAAQVPPHRLVLHARIRAGSQGIPELDRALRAVNPKVFVGAAMTLSDFMNQSLIGARLTQVVGTGAGLACCSSVSR
jgi:predicted permease